MKLSKLGIILAFSLSCAGSAFAQAVHWVDPFIGTAKGGNTFPGALVPWGMVSVSPHNDLRAPSGYVYGRPFLYGFGHVHLSGTNCPDLGSVLIAATVGEVAPDPEKFKSPYDSEAAAPGYYRVHLRNGDITVETTATTRAGMSRFAFPARKDDANILIDTSHRLTTDPPGAPNPFVSRVRIVSLSEAEGSAQSGDFCSPLTGNRQTVYFVVKFSKPAVRTGTWREGVVQDQKEQEGNEGKDAGAYFRFSIGPGETVTAKVGISYVSIQNARMNLEAEMPDWDFNAVRAAASKAWDDELSKILVTGGTADEKKMFYTALYHALLQPSVFSDINGQYKGMGPSGVRKAEGYTRYSFFSLWTTYRTLHPFLGLVYPERELDMAKSLVEMSREGGWLPRWELAGEDTGVMVGDPAVPVLLDTYRQGLTAFDTEAGYQAAVKSLTPSKDNKVYGGLASLLKYGYIPKDDESRDLVWGSVSTTMDYGYDYWCLAQWAKDLGHDADYTKYSKRTDFYRNLADPQTGFFRPKERDGSWWGPFDPLALCCDKNWAGSGGPGFVEGNAWQYLFDVPYDMDNLKLLMGGDDAFVERLQEFFDKGYYDATNEPDLSWPYLFDYVPRQAWRTQRQVREIMAKAYGTGPDGIPGNDDTGTLSSWYLFSALGFYPVCPGSDLYQIGSPLFKEVTIKTNKEIYPGGQLILKTVNDSDRNVYVQSLLIDGLDYKKAFLDHDTLVYGKTLVFRMGSQPDR
jgi:predicted alpha-1,2-mannosidase